MRTGLPGPAQPILASWALDRGWPGDLDRAGLAELTAASAWWIREHGGDDDVRDVAGAIFDVTDWWP